MSIGRSWQLQRLIALNLLLFCVLAGTPASAINIEGVVQSQDRSRPLPAVELHFGSDSYDYANEVWNGHVPPRAIQRVQPDEHGRFEIEIPGPGSWSIQTGGGDFLPLVLELRTWEVWPQGDLPHQTLSLPPARLEQTESVVQVTVVRAKGKPLTETWIRSEPSPNRLSANETPGEPLDSAPRGLGLFWHPAPQVRKASTSGKATFLRAKDQTLHLAAFARGHAVSHSRIEPDAQDVRIEIEPGTTREILVVDAVLSPIPGALVQLHPGAFSVATTDRDGRATLRSTSGDHGLSLFTEEASTTVELPPIDPKEEQPLVIQLPQRVRRNAGGDFTIRGQVLDTEGQPLAWAEVFCWKSDEIVSRDGKGRPRSPAILSTRSGLDGSFQVGELNASGPWSIEVFAAPQYLPSARQGVLAVTDENRSREDNVFTIHLERGLRIRGHVASVHGEPVQGAEIFLIDPVKRLTADEVSGKTATDLTGYFAFEHPIPAVTGLRLLALAYTFAATEVQLDDNLNDETIEVLMEPAPSVSGAVVDPENQPVANALIEIDIVVSPLSRLPHHLAQVVTDTEGVFTLAYLPEGLYEFAVHHQNFEHKVIRHELAAGTDTIEIQLEGAHEYPVTGWVTSTDGKVAGLRLSLRRTDRRSTSGTAIEAITDSNGAFSFTAMPLGSYAVRLHDESRVIAPSHRRVVVAGPTELRIELTSTATVTGSIVGIDSDRLPLLRITEGHSKMRATIDRASESYRIEGVSPGPIRVIARAPGTDRDPGGLFLEHHGMIPTGQENLSLDLDFSEGWTLSGMVHQNGNPVGQGRLSLEGRGNQQSATTDSRGQFSFSNLVSGSYSLHLFTRNSRTVGRYRWVTSEEIQLDSDRTLEIEVPEGAVVSGAIVDSRRVPLAEVEVTLLGEGSRKTAGATLTTTSGSFEITDVPPGSWRLRARRTGYATLLQKIQVGKSPITLDLEMEEAKAQVLRVLRPDGSTPAVVRLDLLTPNGQVFWTSTQTPDAEGLVNLDEAPSGTWRYLVEADGGAFTAWVSGLNGSSLPQELVTQASGGASLELRTFRNEPTVAFELLDAEGLPFRARVLEFLRYGFQEVPFLPPGTWSLTIHAEEGLQHHSFLVRPGQWTQVVID